jgi:hypothetical protein
VELKDGGGAFPNDFGVPGNKCIGMTLRDYFAAKALTGLLSNVNVLAADSNFGWSIVNQEEVGLAEDAYAIADAMLRARGDR